MTTRRLLALITLLAVSGGCRRDAAPRSARAPAVAPSGAFILVSVDESRTLAIPMRDQRGEGDAREDAWYLLNRGGARVVARDLACRYSVDDARRSPDGRFLAVVSAGEGHPCLQVFRLPLIAEGLADEQRETAIVAEINPYPGTIFVEGWQDGRLVVSTDSVLTILDDHGGVSPCLQFDQVQEYAFDPDTAAFTPLTLEASDPVSTFLAPGATDAESLAQRACALRWLKGREALPEMRDLREQLPPDARGRVDALIGELTTREPEP